MSEYSCQCWVWPCCLFRKFMEEFWSFEIEKAMKLNELLWGLKHRNFERNINNGVMICDISKGKWLWLHQECLCDTWNYESMEVKALLYWDNWCLVGWGWRISMTSKKLASLWWNPLGSISSASVPRRCNPEGQSCISRWQLILAVRAVHMALIWKAWKLQGGKLHRQNLRLGTTSGHKSHTWWGSLSCYENLRI